MTPLVAILLAAQLVLAARVVVRLVRSAGGTRIRPSDAAPDAPVAILIPVLNEAARLAACLDGARAQGPEVAEILVVDGGSTDATADVVAAAARADQRVRLLAAGAVPYGWTGKVWNLAVGLRHVAIANGWVLCLDADVRAEPGLVRALVAHARRSGDAALSVATRQRLSGAGEGLVHPACLATLVYRFGIPGHATRDHRRVQANGQCFLARRSVLVATQAFTAARGSLCEDVTTARALAAAGIAVGFFEAGDLVSVAMYDGWHDAWVNWPRSLPMRDQYFGVAGWLGLVEILAVQALPLPVALVATLMGGGPIALVNAGLVAMRVGMLGGMARAYVRRPWTYWLSPLADLPVVLRIWRSAVARTHHWRGHTYRRGALGRFHLTPG